MRPATSNSSALVWRCRTKQVGGVDVGVALVEFSRPAPGAQVAAISSPFADFIVAAAPQVVVLADCGSNWYNLKDAP
jgi:hypothetical protein